MKVNRALEYSSTGVMSIPDKLDKTGHFSIDNWGDHDKRVVQNTGNGKIPRVKRATVFTATIDTQLNEARWKTIIDAARAAVTKRAEVVDNGGGVGYESEGEVFILRDVMWGEQDATTTTGSTEAVPVMPTPAEGPSGSASASPAA
ncbi:hypothetical protein NMY22_g204 [Coprinellus aureogranulatus]|nr:hypothetical protein NMY22_g204 [Coprinellus aureogranulatus]